MNSIKIILLIIIIVALYSSCDHWAVFDGKLRSTITLTKRPYSSNSNSGVSFYGVRCYDVRELLTDNLNEAGLSLQDHFSLKWNEILVKGQDNLPISDIPVDFRIHVQSLTDRDEYNLFLQSVNQIPIQDFLSGDYDIYISEQGKDVIEDAMELESRELSLVFQLTFINVDESSIPINFFDTELIIPFKVRKQV